MPQNTGTTFLAEKLSNHLINEIMKSLPSIQSYIEGTIAKLQKELTVRQSLGAGRGRACLHSRGRSPRPGAQTAWLQSGPF